MTPSRFLLATVFLAVSAIPGSAQSVLWGGQVGQESNTNLYYSINQATGAFLTTQGATMAGTTITGFQAFTADPTTGTVYVIVSVSGGRRLATLNLTTGVATSIGVMSDRFSTLSFNSAGVLCGVTGNGATVPETLYIINKTTAAATLVVALGNGGGGEVIAFNPVNGLMYHWSGGGVNQVFESINLTTLAVTNIPVVVVNNNSEVYGAVWNGSAFFVTDADGIFYTRTTGGVRVVLGNSTFRVRGLALVAPLSPGPAPVSTGIPTLGELGMILLAAMLAMFGAYRLRFRGQAA